MLITAYANRMKLASYRPASVKVRSACLRAFATSLEPHQVTLENATRLHVEAFLARDLMPESRRAYRSHLQAFYRWAVEDGHVSDDPTAKLPAVRVPRGVPRPIRDDDLRKAVESADARTRAWLLLMSLAGLRCIEVANLRPEDVHVTDDGPLLWLRECKGGGQGTVPAHEAILHALMQVPSRNGRWWECSPHHVSQTVNAYLRSLGIRATSHQLRHAAGTSWYRASGHDLLTTARLLRHASVATTQTYALIGGERPSEVVGLVPGPRPSMSA